MSYDLYFYKSKKATLSEQDISNYLTENLASPNEQNNQWWFDNEDTGTYFCFETTDENEFENYNEVFNCFTEFDSVQFMFNLNFVRPDFFGREAFMFVERFIADLDLYVLNPQSGGNTETPYKPKKGDLYENWALANHSAAKERFDNESCFYPMDQTNRIWQHNFNRLGLQAKHDEVYYVPRIYLMEEYKTKKILTQTSWVKHYAYIIPKVDYILIVRHKKSLIKTEETENGFISYKTFIETFGDYFDDLDLTDYKIIRPENTDKVSKLFNSIKFEKKTDKLGLRIPWETVFNSRS
ncbi:hypothetical protein BH11BAC5_BH11BAC5_47550 [soil metagenome]